jgi:hypothetical protein
MKSRPIEESPPRELAYPEDFLWVRERDNTLTTISAERLIVLRERQQQRCSEFEMELIQHPEDLDWIIHCLGNTVVTLDRDQKFPSNGTATPAK